MYQSVPVLLAMPTLGDSLFSHSVILLGEEDSDGALGLIVNLPTNTSVREILEVINISNGEFLEVPVLFGGPVQTDFFWVLHSSEFLGKSTIRMNINISLSSAMEVLPLLDTKRCPQIYHIGVGYSGWGPAQLEKEIEQGSWWATEMDLIQLFSMPYDHRWKQGVKNLGVDPTHFFDYTNPAQPSIN